MEDPTQHNQLLNIAALKRVAAKGSESDYDSEEGSPDPKRAKAGTGDDEADEAERAAGLVREDSTDFEESESESGTPFSKRPKTKPSDAAAARALAVRLDRLAGLGSGAKRWNEGATWWKR